MRFDCGKDEKVEPCRVIDLEAGKQIPFCRMADEETGEYVRYDVRQGANGERRWIIGPDGRVATIAGKTRLRIELLAPGEPYFLPKTAQTEVQG